MVVPPVWDSTPAGIEFLYQKMEKEKDPYYLEKYKDLYASVRLYDYPWRSFIVEHLTAEHEEEYTPENYNLIRIDCPIDFNSKKIPADHTHRLFLQDYMKYLS